MSLPRVLSLESRRQAEMVSLIQRAGGVPTVVESMRELPLENQQSVLQFAQELLSGRVDLTIFLTGVGARALLETLETVHPRTEFVPAFAQGKVAVRGPKPVAVLREWGIKIDLRAAEPNTWRELIQLFQVTALPLKGTRIVVQEYGKPSLELHQALRDQGAVVTPVFVYHWALPKNLQPLQKAVQQTVSGEFDILLFTSAQQLHHLLEVAETMSLADQWLVAARTCFIGSIGPTTSETLSELGLPVSLEPSHPKMGHLVNETLAAWNSNSDFCRKRQI